MIESLTQLARLMQSHGGTLLYAKRLSPNDNSKNQIYLGSDFSSLNIIPNKGVYTDDSSLSTSRRARFKADLDFYWVDEHGKTAAPNAQLILYPDYPEVRMSGFLSGCANAPSALMRSRDAGRILFFCVTQQREILGYVISNDHPLKKELDARCELHSIGVFIEIPFETDSKIILLNHLRKIHEKGWINSCRLKSDGTRVAYESENGGGYTLEAELGITPNGYSQPDFHGWEVKQHGVKNLLKPVSGSAITLMTPEPSSGFYCEQGVEKFIRRFGYKDKKTEDRLNFSGIHKCGIKSALTGLTLILDGFNSYTGKIEKVDGGISLITDTGEHAATWHFTDMMKHWNRKHAKAVYIPSICRTEPSRQYRYGNLIRIGEGTDFCKLLKSIASGKVYYDPGINLKQASSAKPVIKRRSQFRMKQRDIHELYHSFEMIDYLIKF